MSVATGMIITFAIIAFGGLGLAVFAICHRQRVTDHKENGEQITPSEPH